MSAGIAWRPAAFCWSSPATPTTWPTRRRPQDPDVLYSDRDVIADLGAIDCSARVERTEHAARAVAGNDRPALDTVVRARKLGPDS